MDRTSLYLDGAWVAPHGTDLIEVENPYTERVFATVPAGDAVDVHRAVAAARAAFDGWAALTPADRASYLERLHAALSARAETVARTVSQELGTPLKVSARLHATLPLSVLRSAVELAPTLSTEERVGNSVVVREPAGVVGAITPWNYPMHQVVAKVAMALAAGCTVVLKPSELTPLAAYLLLDAAHEAGLPPGVLNLVPGTGPEAGAALAGHPDVDLVSFTGSTATGRRIARLAADRVARVSLELGGKSANVILDDADLVRAVKVGVGNAFLNSGQTCTAWTRMLVPEALYAETVSLAVSAAAKYTMGDPFDEGTRQGPLVSAAQRVRVLDFIELARKEGAVVGASGPVPTQGYFVAPTVLSDVDPSATVAQEEIFGPVLCVIPYADDDEAVAIANDSRYGLAGAVWSNDPDRALAVARRLRTGAVDINGGAFNPVAPLGGYKQSGVGRELGAHGLAEFCEIKALQW